MTNNVQNISFLSTWIVCNNSAASTEFIADGYKRWEYKKNIFIIGN